MDLSLKQFTKEDLFEYTLSIKSRRHSFEGLKKITNIGIGIAPFYYLVIRPQGVDSVEQIPTLIDIFGVVSVFISLICIVFSFNKIAVKHRKYQQFLFLVVLFLTAFFCFITCVFLYTKDYFHRTNQFVSTNQIDLISAVGILGGIVIFTLGYISVFNYIYKGNARKGRVTVGGKENLERALPFIFSMFMPVTFPMLLLLNHKTLDGVFNLIIGAATSYGIIFFLPGLYITFYTEKKFPELFKGNRRRKK